MAFVGWEAILGRSLDDPVVLDYLAGHGCRPSGLHYVCTPAGSELSFTTGRRLVSILLFGPTAGTMSTYPGQLPGGLAWTDTRADVDRQLGPPQSDHPGFAPVQAWSLYSVPPILITWNTVGAAAPDTVMHHLEVKAS